MNTVQRFFRRYFLTTIGILLLFVFLNFVLAFATLLSANHNTVSPELSVSRLAGMVTMADGTIHASPEIGNRLAEANAWAMLLDDGGTVIWGGTRSRGFAS